MKSEAIAYAARINAAYWLIRKARKIARRLADTTSEQQQAIESVCRAVVCEQRLQARIYGGKNGAAMAGIWGLSERSEGR
jgi:hypothetical protein